MASYHQTVDEIRAFVQATDQTRSPALEGLARTYAEACAEASRRLGQCQQLLRQGLRSEAIQLADAEPKLLDLIAALDFPEREEWDGVVQIYGLSGAPKIQVSGAEFLNEAYALEDPLQDLLRTHRRLALARAPVRARMAVMRKLAAQDAGNPIWSDDLRIFEKLRFHQIQDESASAARHHDVDAMGRLLAEIEETVWVETPPRALVQGLRKVDAQFRGQQNRAILADLESEFNDAFAAFDAEKARRVRERWLAMVSAAPLAPGDTALDRVQPILDWLDDQDRRDESDRQHEAAIRTLNEALDAPGRISPVVFGRLANAVLRHERGMPESIQKRYVERMAREQTAEARRRTMIITAAAATVLLVVGGIGYTIHRQARVNDASQAALAVSDMLELGELVRAGDFLKTLGQTDAALLEHPAMVEAQTKFQAAQEKEAQRQIAFEQAYHAAESLPATDQAPKALEAVRALAVLTTEKEAVSKLAQRRQTAFLESQKHQEDQARPKLDAMRGKIASLRKSLAQIKKDPSTRTRIETDIGDVQRQTAAIVAEMPSVEGEVRQLAQVIQQDVEGLRTSIDQDRRLASIEDDMMRAIRRSTADERGGIADYAALIKKAAEVSPDSPRGKSLAQLDREKPAWEAVAAWNQLVQSWAKQPPAGSPRQDQERLDACTQFLAQHPLSPDAAEVGECKNRFQAIVRRSQGPEALTPRLQQLFADPLVNSVWMIKVSSPNQKTLARRYYLSQKPEEGSNMIKHLAGFDGRERNTPIVRDHIVLSDWSSQSRIAAKYKVLLAQEVEVARWDGLMIDLATAIRLDPEIDPLLQMALLRKVIGYAGQGSEPLRQALAPALAILEQSDVDVTVPWMDPANSDADRLRPGAAAVVRSLPDLAEVKKQARQIADRQDRRLPHRPRAIGWLASEEQTWQVRNATTLPDEGELFVAVPQESKGAVWKRVAKVAKGKVVLSAEDPAALVEGRLVFLREPAVDHS